MSATQNFTALCRRSCSNIDNSASYSVNVYLRENPVNDRISVAKYSYTSDQDRAERIRIRSPERKFASLGGEFDPRPLYPSSDSDPNSVNSEFTRLSRRAEQTRRAITPDIDVKNHLVAAGTKVSECSGAILTQMGFDANCTGPVSVSKAWLSAPNTHDYIQREVAFCFPNNSIMYTPTPTADNPRPAASQIELKSVVVVVPIAYGSNGWVPGAARVSATPSALVARDGRTWFKPV